MELDRYLELRSILQQWRLRLAASVRGRIEASPRWLARLEAIYGREGAGEEFTVWLDRWCRQAAIQFILRILFLRVLEDRRLLGAIRLRTTDGQQMWRHLTRNLGAASYVQWCFWDAAHLLPDLFSPTDYDLVLPEDELVQRFLDDVWRRPDPNRPGWLRFDFQPDPERADAGFQTRFIGDLYQELDAEIRARYALLQTPDFISQFILEHTLLKCFAEKDFREVTLIDPTCGSGHFEVDAFWMFVARYEADAGKTREQLSVAERTLIARTIIEQHLFGCDINPYATALTRFRLLLAACDYAQPASLRDLRDLRFNIVTIDSLIPYEKMALTEWQGDSQIAQALGQPEAIERSLPVLRRRYHVVVGNPPYIFSQDALKRRLYSMNFMSASGKFGLAAPFTERFLQLATEGGFVGLINSNAFATRQFGRPLVEQILPQYDVNTIIDLSGAYIPGHGTPTVILFARNQQPSTDRVKVISCSRGESGTPANPREGVVWLNIEQHYQAVEFRNEYVVVTTRSRASLAKHPWILDNRGAKVLSRLTQGNEKRLASLLSHPIGILAITGADEIYLLAADSARRLQLPPSQLLPLTIGEEVRDWEVDSQTLCLLPYGQETYEAIDLSQFPSINAYLQPFRSLLETRVYSGSTRMIDLGYQWYELPRFSKDKLKTAWLITYASVSTHNHFVVTAVNTASKQSAPVIKLKAENEGAYTIVTGLLNTSFALFQLKQAAYNKGTGEDPVRDRCDFAGTNVELVVLPKSFPASYDSETDNQLFVLAKQLREAGAQLAGLKPRKLFERPNEAFSSWNSTLSNWKPPHPLLSPPFTTALDLRSARERVIIIRRDISCRMIFLQEEMDWLAYEMYGLIKKAPMAEDYLTPSQYKEARLQLGQRPFEIAGRGYRGDWLSGYQPDPLPDYLRPLTEARIALIESNPDIALLEDPLYKRRWVPPDYDKEFRDAAQWWLAEKLEYALEQHGKPISLQRWARLLSRDERVMATLEVLTGSPMFDLEQELLKVIRANAAPNRPEHYLKPAGLRKYYAARQARLAAPDEPPPVPEYSSGEFSDAVTWRLRGKLNIPRERFIAYVEFDHSQRGSDAPNSEGPWYGWAGWDAGQRADALAFLLDRANRAGWQVHYQQCGLRAALRELLPDLKQTLPQGEYLEFEGIAGRCGISLDTPCYCQAYRDGMAEGRAGVPGVSAEVLEVKVVQSEVKRPGRVSRKKNDSDQQLDLGIG